MGKVDCEHPVFKRAQPMIKHWNRLFGHSSIKWKMQKSRLDAVREEERVKRFKLKWSLKTKAKILNAIFPTII